jgi:hypothetical protein
MKNYLILEDKSLGSLKERMKELLKTKKYRLDFKYGFTVSETITRYDNVETGIRYQGILQKL